MDTPQPFKKRRLDSALHKPFKSPLRTPLKPSSNAPNASTLSNAHIPSSDPIEAPENAPKLVPSQKTHVKSHSTSTLQPTSTSSPDDPVHVQSTLTTRTKSLDRTVIKMRQDIDTLSQALSILRSTKASELEELEEKWRGAARLAAEEIFASARDRVNRMGGVGAWRERERERVERMRGGFEEERKANADDEDGYEHEDGEGEERYREKPEKWEYDFREVEVEDDGDGRQSEEEKYQDDDVGLPPRVLYVRLLTRCRLSRWI